MDVDRFHRKFNYRFSDGTLLARACRHSSVDRVSHNAALATLGDLVIGTHIGSEIFQRYPNITRGPLSSLKKINVDNERLACACVNSGLHTFLNSNISTLDDQIRRMRREIAKFGLYSNGMMLHSNGRIEYPKSLADFLEAIVGAVYLDCKRNMRVTGRVINALLGNLIVDYVTFQQRPFARLSQSRLDLQHTTIKLLNGNWWSIDYNNVTIATVVYGGAIDVLKNRVAHEAIEYLWHQLGIQI